MRETGTTTDAPGDESVAREAPAGPATWIAWIVLVLVSVTAPVAVATRIFPDHSPDRDDVGYLSQATALRQGELTLPADEYDPYFLPFLSGVEGDRVVFKYQPVWPALIAASEAVTGGPEGALALTGLASTLAVAALAFEVGRRRRTALVAGYVFATSPWFLVQSGTYLAYPASAALLCGATALVLRAVRTRATWSWVAAGVVMALGVFHRPYDAVLGLLPLAIWYLITQRRSGRMRREIGWIALGAAPFALLFFAYNRTVTGRFSSLAFSLVGPNDTFGFGLRSSLADPGREGFYDFTPGEAWRTVLAFAASLTDWLPGGLLILVLAVLGLRLLRGRSVGWLVLAQGLIFPFGYFIWWGAANAWSYRLHLLLGPLYWFPLLGTVSVLGAVAVDRISTARPGVLRKVPGAALAVLAVVGLVAVSAATSGDTRRDLRNAREGQEQEIETLRPGPGARTLTIAPPNFDVDIYLPVPIPESFDDDHVIAMDPSAGGGRFDLLDRFPDRTVVEVLRVHDLGKPFDVARRVRRELSVTTAPTIDLAVQTVGPGTPYAGIEGQEEPVESVDGRVEITVAAEPTPGAVTIPEGGEPVWVVVGLEDFELHWLARNVDGQVQLIEPPTPIRRYQFPGHDEVDVIEDTSIRIQQL